MIAEYVDDEARERRKRKHNTRPTFLEVLGSQATVAQMLQGIKMQLAATHAFPRPIARGDIHAGCCHVMHDAVTVTECYRQRTWLQNATGRERAT